MTPEDPRERVERVALAAINAGLPEPTNRAQRRARELEAKRRARRAMREAGRRIRERNA